MSYYKDLNILPTASMEEISIAYNNLINNNTNSEDKMKYNIELEDNMNFNKSLENKMKYNKAFATLSNYNSRRKYDNLMEENSQSVTAYNIDKYNTYSSYNNENDENNNSEVLKNNNEDTNNNILNKIETLFLDLNIRLESIEKKIYSNEKSNNNFYKERKKINTRWTKGKKVVNIVTDVNNNGELSRKLKAISYDSDGNQDIKYKTINNKNISEDI